MLYMDVREIILKLMIDAIMIIILYSIGINIIICVILAHTFNMFFNGHYYAMKSHMGFHETTVLNFLNYVEMLQKRMSKKSYFCGAAAYGSLSRNQFKPSSDIDIRVFPKRGLINWTRTVLWVFIERLRAFLKAFPLDMYAFDMAVIDKKMRVDEPPIIFSDPEKIVAEKYPHHVPFDTFLSNFKKKHIQGND